MIVVFFLRTAKQLRGVDPQREFVVVVIERLYMAAWDVTRTLVRLVGYACSV